MRRVAQAAEEDVARDGFVGAGGIEPVGAGQIDQLNWAPDGKVARPAWRSTVTPG